MMVWRLCAEFLGSLILAGVVVGSGIQAQELSGGNGAIALLGNTLATAAILYVLVVILGPVSGAHFNPAVTLVMVIRRDIAWLPAAGYAVVQVAGCCLGAVLAHAMFDLALVQMATTDRSGSPRMLSEAVATFMLVLGILGAIRWRPQAAPVVVALTITAGYWWTASTSFANPAITVARTLSDTFAGVRLEDAPGFAFAQFAGALAALGAGHLLFPPSEASS